MALITLRYDLRAPAWAATQHPELYRTCLEQCAWADEAGFDAIVISEHHGVEDGYLPAPLTLAAAIAARTKRIPISIAAALIPLHDPIRMAEQIAVLDLISGGRVSIVAGIGYRREEFEMAGIDRKSRGAMTEEFVNVMRQAWTGGPFEWKGRTIQVTPVPLSKPYPLMFGGGSTELAARRAARLHMGFFPAIEDASLEQAYNEEADRVGFQNRYYHSPKGPGFVHVTEDPDKAWEQIAPYAWYDADTYRSWQTAGQRSQVTPKASDIDGLRKEGIYAVVTPDECVALAEEMGDRGGIILHPLLCGMPAELGWQSLELFREKVLPRLRPSS
jgi:alkanesulfonate monooxygenase SsuD/methylene tetrahydromethanopterin reductase-like flavin-dependent oxidoreductase (luciferase family)